MWYLEPISVNLQHKVRDWASIHCWDLHKSRQRTVLMDNVEMTVIAQHLWLGQETQSTGRRCKYTRYGWLYIFTHWKLLMMFFSFKCLTDCCGIRGIRCDMQWLLEITFWYHHTTISCLISYLSHIPSRTTLWRLLSRTCPCPSHYTFEDTA